MIDQKIGVKETFMVLDKIIEYEETRLRKKMERICDDLCEGHEFKRKEVSVHIEVVFSLH